MFNNITFAYPYFLYLLIIIPGLIYWYWRKNKTSTPNVTFSSLKLFDGARPSLKVRLRHLPAVLRWIALALLIVAMARPQTFSSGENIYTEGIDIVMLLDISGSMLAEDFKPNRLEAAKEVIDQFISGRTSDKIGLVIFAGESLLNVH